MADVKVLLIGAARGNWQKGQKGDIWEVVSSQQDWGSATTAPAWVRLTVTGVAGTQAEAEALIRAEWPRPFSSAFDYTEIAGAGAGEQRYRVAMKTGTIKVPLFNAIRNGITARFATTGSAESQQNRVSFDFDGGPGIPLDEIEQQLDQSVGNARRYQFSDNFIDNQTGSVAAGQPAEISVTKAEAEADIEDKAS